MNSEGVTIKIPSLVEDMSFKTYLADPAPEPSLTSSLVRELLQTAPRRVWENCSRLNPDYEAKQKGTFDLGSAAHELFIGAGAGIVVINEDSWRTKVAKEAKAAAYAAGKTPILIANMSRVEAMAAAATKQFNRTLAVSQFSMREVSIFWNEAGVLCRCRPDFYSAGPSDPRPVIVHYKTTGITITPYTLSKYAAIFGLGNDRGPLRGGSQGTHGRRAAPVLRGPGKHAAVPLPCGRDGPAIPRARPATPRPVARCLGLVST